jgi:hypothetical protein
MSKATYIIAESYSLQHSLRITVKEKSKQILFTDRYKNGTLIYETSVKEEQEEIEKSKLFLSGAMVKDGGESKAGADEEPETFDPVTFDEVTTFAQAKAILMEEPYEIKASKLKNSESILKAAESVNVSFPNLKA